MSEEGCVVPVSIGFVHLLRCVLQAADDVAEMVGLVTDGLDFSPRSSQAWGSTGHRSNGLKMSLSYGGLSYNFVGYEVMIALIFRRVVSLLLDLRGLVKY